MRGAATSLLFTVAFVASALPVHAQGEVIAAIQVDGNTLTPDSDVIADSLLSVGMPFSDVLLARTADRLRAMKKFQQVQVLKRFASIADPTQITVLIRLDEGPVRVVSGASPGQPARVVRRHRLNMMFVPLLDSEDGYGLSYGAQFAISGNAGTSRRLVIPLTWGGDKRAEAEFQQEFSSRFPSRVKAGVLVQRRTHPFFDNAADRTRYWARAELAGRAKFRGVRAGATVARQTSSLMMRTDTSRSVGGDLVLDTRLDPMLPRNAIYARAAVERLQFPRRALTRTEAAVEGYVGLYRDVVLVLGLRHEGFNRPAPPFFKAVIGGAGSLRGFRVGTAVGDAMANGSAEVRIPLTSPLTLAKFGTSIFIDTGTVYDAGQRARDQRWRQGAGGGVWASASLFRLSLMVARGMGAGTRVHFGAGLTF